MNVKKNQKTLDALEYSIMFFKSDALLTTKTFEVKVEGVENYSASLGVNSHFSDDLYLEIAEKLLPKEKKQQLPINFMPHCTCGGGGCQSSFYTDCQLAHPSFSRGKPQVHNSALKASQKETDRGWVINHMGQGKNDVWLSGHIIAIDFKAWTLRIAESRFQLNLDSPLYVRVNAQGVVSKTDKAFTRPW